MQLNLAIPSLTIGQEVEAKSFAIGNLAVILHLLRSKMYSHPIRTIVQEIASNARDANREVGNGNKPIHIHLPTRETPELWIRDEGPGISPERMDGVYLQYGNSTKRDSNDQTGCFGLGAKSPFAYCSSFGIETVTPENGKNVLRVYIATVDQSQIGKVLLVHQTETDQPCGTTIKVPVKPQDFDEFKRWTNIVLNRWNPRPKTNLEDVFDEVYEPDVIGENWEIYSSRTYERGFFYYEDGVPYEVKEENIDNLPSEFGVFFNKVRLNVFGKGKVQVTGNRESLDYQPHVIQHLKDQMTEIFKEVNLRLTQEVASCDGLWDAMCMVHKTQEKWGVEILRNVQWGGQPVPNKQSYDFSYAELWKVEGDSTKSFGMKIKRRHYGISARRSNMLIEGAGEGRPNPAYVQKAYQFTKEHYEKQGVTDWDLYIVAWKVGEFADKEKLSMRFNDWKIRNLMDFKPERKPRMKGVRTGYGSVAKVREFNHGSHSSDSYEERWSKTELDFADPDGGIYVLLHARQLEDTTIEESQIRLFCSVTGKTIYGIPRRLAFHGGKLTLGSQWIPFKQAANDELDKMIQKQGNHVWQIDTSYLPNYFLDTSVRQLLINEIKNKNVNGKIAHWFSLETVLTETRPMKVLAEICNRTKDLFVKKWGDKEIKELTKIFPILMMWNGEHYMATNALGRTEAKNMVRDFLVDYIHKQEAIENARLAAEQQQALKNAKELEEETPKYGLLKVKYEELQEQKD